MRHFYAREAAVARRRTPGLLGAALLEGTARHSHVCTLRIRFGALSILAITHLLFSCLQNQRLLGGFVVLVKDWHSVRNVSPNVVLETRLNERVVVGAFDLTAPDDHSFFVQFRIGTARSCTLPNPRRRIHGVLFVMSFRNRDHCTSQFVFELRIFD